MKTCTQCKEPKHTEDFYSGRGNCKPCHARKANKRPNAPAYRRSKLSRHYGLTEADYYNLFVSQSGVCAICWLPETMTGTNGKTRSLCVDHDHRCCPGRTSCGECVRGLLCSACNSGIGKLRDSASLLDRASDYIKEGI